MQKKTVLRDCYFYREDGNGIPLAKVVLITHSAGFLTSKIKEK